MTLYLDASALVAAHLDTPARQVVLDAMAADPDWCSSGLTLMESLALIDRVLDQPVLRSDLEDLVRLTWDRVAIVPVDQRCLDRAATLMREQPLRLRRWLLPLILAEGSTGPATCAISTSRRSKRLLPVLRIRALN